MTTPTSPPTGYQPEIDGLRAIAVCAVVLYHAVPALLPGGFVGVDVFFVISGYLITRLLRAEWQRSGRIDFAAFYARRVRRLLPALAVMLVAVLAATALLLGRHGDLAVQTGQSAAAALAFVANHYFQRHAGGYFDTPAESMVLLHVWSLSVEEQYYFVYPLLVALLLRFAPRRAVPAIVLLSVASLGLAEMWRTLLSDAAYYAMPARFWELAAGCLAAFVPATARPARLDAWGLPAGVALVAFACVVPPPPGGFPGVGALPAVLGATLVVLGVHRGAIASPVAGLLRSRPAVAVGLVSYSFYLWHWPVLVIDAQWRLEPASPAWRLGLCVLAFALAWLSWRFVETSFRRAGARPARVLWTGAATALLLGLAAIGVARYPFVPEPARLAAARAAADQPEGMAACHYSDTAPVTGPKPASCGSDPGRAPSVLLWGDSHAWAWRPFARGIAEASGAAMASFTMNSCLPGDWAGSPPARLPAPCPAMNALALEALAPGHVDTLVVAMRWPMDAARTETGADALRDRLAGLRGALDRLGHVPRILLMGPLPVMPRSVPDCLSLGWESRCVVPRAVFEADVAVVRDALDALAAAHPNVRIVDPAGFFCDEAACPAVRDGMALYWDTNHVSAGAAGAFARRYLDEPAKYTRRRPGDSPPPAGPSR